MQEIDQTKKLATLLQNERIRQGFSVRKFAKVCGVSPSTLYRFEKGTYFDKETLKKICDSLHVSLAIIKEDA